LFLKLTDDFKSLSDSRSLFLPDKFIDQASPNVMYKEAGLDVTGITTTILDVLGIADIRSNKIKIIK